MAVYKLHYFNVTSLGEPIRYLFAYGKLNFEDIRYEDAVWDTIKSKTPFGQMPYLEIDGKPFAQSTAISRHLAKKVGLTGKDDLEDLQIDMTVDLYNDFRLKIQDWYYDPMPESKAAKKEPLFKEHIPFFLGKFEHIAKDNGGHLVNGKLTWADIYFVAPLKYYKALAAKDFLVGYPSLQELVKKVESHPQIASYIAKRPASDR